MTSNLIVIHLMNQGCVINFVRWEYGTNHVVTLKAFVILTWSLNNLDMISIM